LGEVICPLHEYRYNSITGEEVNNKCEAAVTINLKQEEDGVYLQLKT